MLAAHQEIATTQPGTAHEEAVVDSLSGATAAQPSSLHDIRRELAEGHAAQALSNADLGPVATVQTNTEVDGQQVSTVSDVTLGINDQAQANATEAGNRLRARGASSDAVVRAEQFVKHHTIAAQGGAATQVGSTFDQAEAVGVTQPQDGRQPVGMEIDQPQAMADKSADIQSLMESLAEQIEAAQITQADGATLARGVRPGVERKNEIEDPLEHSPFMRIEQDVEEAAGLGDRFDLNLSATAVAQDGQLNGIDIPPTLRFDLELEPAAQTTQAPRLDAALEVTGATAGTFKLDRDQEPGQISRSGRERRSVFVAAA
ncbi:MAG: hypothetical protein J0M12_02970 [Deltaproteobacteria bacterium]|nr:hypothetical protein [Deltaproteobacteria bacterium]